MKVFEHENSKIPQDAENMNLCYLGNDGYQVQGTKKYRELISHPDFVCKNCGRAAHEAKNLCSPDRIE